MAQAAVAPSGVVRIKNILFATDFSELSRSAVPYLGCIAHRFGSTVFPCYVIPDEPRYEVPMDQVADELKLSRKQAEQKITELLNDRALRDVPQHMLVERGEVWDALQQVIDNNNIDMVVIGTHGHRGVGKMIFGSVAEQVFRQATCPVLVVGPNASRHELEDGTFSRILFTTDCSDASMEHLPFVAELANTFGAFLKVLSVLQPNDQSMLRTLDAVVAAKTQLLREAVSKLTLQHQSEVIVELGLIADQILRSADVNNVDLIVMGARSTSRPAVISHLPAGKTHLVASRAHCPVLTLRASGRPS
jgi:nucleotide-binding universal stress UspA family protein